jgi:hypothetical protein
LSDQSSTALARIAVTVVVERRRAKSPWLDFVWQPVAVLAGNPEAAPWTPLGEAAETTLFYAGNAAVELYRTETAKYQSNLTSSAPSLWVVLRPDASRVGYKLQAVTADPAEAEALAGAGADVVEPVPMPAIIAGSIGEFVVKHHVERPFFKRRREQRDAARAFDGRAGGRSEE